MNLATFLRLASINHNQSCLLDDLRVALVNNRLEDWLTNQSHRTLDRIDSMLTRLAADDMSRCITDLSFVVDRIENEIDIRIQKNAEENR